MNPRAIKFPRAAMLMVIAVGVVATSALAKKPGGGSQCPRPILCNDIWDPVICNDGQVYGNSCYAYQQCATGCVPYGDGGPVELGARGINWRQCPRNLECLDVWNPVICDDGQIYSNDCYAARECATGCVPYGDEVAAGRGWGGGRCGGGIYCLDVWDPVICDDGQVYGNSCYALVACATGCEPYGGEIAAQPGGAGLCGRKIECLDVWNPVICDNGQVYSNLCYARRACATGCEPYGEEVAAAAPCVRPRVCPLLYAPVICNNGKVYVNSCYAQKACATGCEPYDDGGGVAAKPGGGGTKCPRPIECPDVYDPVVCSNGVEYPNACYAYRACATGCGSY